jgi:hypothetical protein
VLSMLRLLGPACVLQEEAMSRKLRELAVKVERPPREPQVDHLGRAAAVGGRKTSVARVRELLPAGLAVWAADSSRELACRL